MRRSAIQVEVVFLYVFSVIAFVPGKPEQPFFQDGIPLVPQGNSKAKHLVPVADSAQTILVPPISAGASVVVREIIPGCAVRAVIFPHRAPGAFTQVRSPALPVLATITRSREPGFFSRHDARYRICA